MFDNARPMIVLHLLCFPKQWSVLLTLLLLSVLRVQNRSTIPTSGRQSSSSPSPQRRRLPKGVRGSGTAILTRAAPTPSDRQPSGRSGKLADGLLQSAGRQTRWMVGRTGYIGSEDCVLVGLRAGGRWTASLFDWMENGDALLFHDAEMLS